MRVFRDGLEVLIFRFVCGGCVLFVLEIVILFFLDEIVRLIGICLLDVSVSGLVIVLVMVSGMFWSIKLEFN